VIFNRLDHHLMLKFGPGHLHAPGTTDRWMWNVSITSDFIAGVDHNDPLVQIIGQDTGNFPESCGFAHTGASHQQQRLTAVEQITHDCDCSENGSSNTTGEADHITAAITDGTDAMQCSLDAGTIISTELADPAHHLHKIVALQAATAKFNRTTWIARFRNPTEIEHDLKQLITTFSGRQSFLNCSGQQREQSLQVIGDALSTHGPGS